MKDSSNKLIAKNTLFLYIRMILSLGVSLYTSRVVLNTLGVEDFGIYNLVGGIVILFSFINSSMTTATQRFLNYEIGKSNQEGVHKVFCLSVNVYFIIALLIVLLSETIGLWFLNTQLNIPEARISEANIVYQFSILTFIVNIFKVPYNASIIAYEKMDFYAWMSIVEVVIKLFIVYVLVYVIYDKLILYSILTFALSIIMFLLYLRYCYRNFNTCRYKYIYDKEKIKELLGFSGWSMFGSVAVIGSNQGIAMILNVFLGVTINAAMGIANQVNTALYGFVSGFRVAFNPQLVKTYASGDIQAHKNLLFRTSKISYFLLLILAVPVLMNTSLILSVWLNIVPNYAVSFTQLIIVLSLIESLSGPFWMSVSATGKIKKYQIIVSGIFLLNLPLAYLFLAKEMSPEYVFVGKIVIALFLLCFRVFYVKGFLKFSFIEVLKSIVIRVFVVTLLVVVMLFWLKKMILFQENEILNTIVVSIVSILLSIIFVFFFGITRVEKQFVTEFIRSKIK